MKTIWFIKNEFESRADFPKLIKLIIQLVKKCEIFQNLNTIAKNELCETFDFSKKKINDKLSRSNMTSNRSKINLFFFTMHKNLCRYYMIIIL